MRCNGSNWAVYSPGSWGGFRNDLWALWAGVIMRLEHHLVGGYVRYISPYIIIIITLNGNLHTTNCVYVAPIWQHCFTVSATHCQAWLASVDRMNIRKIIVCEVYSEYLQYSTLYTCTVSFTLVFPPLFLATFFMFLFPQTRQSAFENFWHVAPLWPLNLLHLKERQKSD